MMPPPKIPVAKFSHSRCLGAPAIPRYYQGIAGRRQGERQRRARRAAGKVQVWPQRDMDMIGVVEGYDELQLRVLVRWDHPDFKDLPPDHRGNVEPLPPFYIDLVQEG